MIVFWTAYHLSFLEREQAVVFAERYKYTPNRHQDQKQELDIRSSSRFHSCVGKAEEAEDGENAGASLDRELSRRGSGSAEVGCVTDCAAGESRRSRRSWLRAWLFRGFVLFSFDESEGGGDNIRGKKHDKSMCTAGKNKKKQHKARSGGKRLRGGRGGLCECTAVRAAGKVRIRYGAHFFHTTQQENAEACLPAHT